MPKVATTEAFARERFRKPVTIFRDRVDPERNLTAFDVDGERANALQPFETFSVHLVRAYLTRKTLIHDLELRQTDGSLDVRQLEVEAERIVLVVTAGALHCAALIF